MKKDWFPRNRSQQLVMFTNILAKIETYETVLPITTAQVAKIQLICETFIAVYNFVEQARATLENLTDWQNDVFNSKEVEDVPPTPVFTEITLPEGAQTGIFMEFRELVDLIKASPRYTIGIGEDLMIVAPESDPLLEEEVVPDLKVTTSTGYVVHVKGSLQCASNIAKKARTIG